MTQINGEMLGLAVVALGGGREVETATINPAVGLSQVVRLGDHVAKGQPMARVHAAMPSEADAAAKRVRAAITLGPDAPPTAPLVLERIAP